MLYQLQEFNRALLEPLSSWAQTTAKAFVNPNNPLSYYPVSQRIAAGYELLYRLGKEYEKPDFGIRTIEVLGKKVTVTEFTSLKKPFCNLLRFKRYSDDVDVIKAMKKEPIVLVVAPLSGHHSSLLRDTVSVLLQNHKVYLTDWVDARLVPTSEGKFHLDDYVYYIQEFIRFIGADNLHVISVCQPTVPVLAAISLMASNGEKTPVTMTMMGGPIDARKSPTAVNSLAMTKSFEWFENNVIYTVPPNHPGAGRKVYPGFLQHAGFVAMNPDRHLRSHWDYFQDLLKGDAPDAEAHRKFYDEYNAVLDMDSAYYLETIKTVFQDFALPKGTWKVGGQLVRPQDIKTTSLLAIEGELDDISGSGQTSAALELCAGIPKNKKEEYEVKGAGHYGIFSGRRWREMVYPKISEFIRKHPGTPMTPVVAKSTSRVSKAVAKSATVAKKVTAPVAAKKSVSVKTTAKPVAAKKVAAKVTRTRSSSASGSKA
jgi:poly(3-hydroxybutyrate) depolymerase